MSSGSKAKKWLSKITSGEPIAHIGSRKAEDFWPTTLDKETVRAATILRSYFMDGFIVPYRTMNKVREQVIKHSQAVLVFHVLREGLHPPGTNGSGVIVARQADGSWSPPSAVLIQTHEWQFVEDADIYDCLCVINSNVEQFLNASCTLGQDIQTTVGPVGGGATADNAIKDRSSAPCWTWVKGKNQWCDAKIDGTVVFQRIGEKERFYGVEGIQSAQILKGQVHAPTGPLMEFTEVLKACELQDWSHRKLPSPGSPGEYKVKPPEAESLREYEATLQKNGASQDVVGR